MKFSSATTRRVRISWLKDVSSISRRKMIKNVIESDLDGSQLRWRAAKVGVLGTCFKLAAEGNVILTYVGQREYLEYEGTASEFFTRSRNAAQGHRNLGPLVVPKGAQRGPKGGPKVGPKGF